ncbi:hypothetical protein T484DRAFT_1805378 [Baffinella frigidus]|nr:hypothetical protein T484DRAFT_1805378 [Cryptophyta sp. CCMP2293]
MAGRHDLCDTPPGELPARLEELQEMAKKHQERAALQSSGIVAQLARLLTREAGKKEEGSVVDQAVELIASLCCDDASRKDAVDSGAVSALVQVLTSAPSSSGGADARVGAVKALLNITQGACKDRAEVLHAAGALAALALAQLSGPAEHGSPGAPGKELGLYLLMALTNLANGGEALKGVLLKGGAVEAAGAALERWGMAGGRSVGMQASKLQIHTVGFEAFGALTFVAALSSWRSPD